MTNRRKKWMRKKQEERMARAAGKMVGLYEGGFGVGDDCDEMVFGGGGRVKPAQGAARCR